MIKSIDSNLVFVCIINEYSLIADLHIFVYGRAECASISLKCTKVKLLTVNNFDENDIIRFLKIYQHKNKGLIMILQ